MKMKLSIIGAALGGSMLLVGAAQATVIVDTIQGDSFGASGGYYALENQTNPWMGQMSVSDQVQFTSPMNGEINNVTAFIGGQGNITLGIVRDNNGSPSASFIDSVKVSLGNGPVVLTGLDWSISNGGTYWLSAVPSSDTNGHWYMSSSWGPVAQLQSFMGQSRLWQGGSELPEFSISATSAVSSVPETSTWAMMLSGFAGLGFVGYRRHKMASVSA
jgi:hypothetical protein